MKPSEDILDVLLEGAQRLNDRHERDLWLIHQCGGDQEKLKEIRSLLNASEKTVFMDTPLEAVQEVQLLLESLVGKQLGPFELLRQIGKGGMGAVYLAQQLQPLTRLVAIKIIQRNMETKQILERFQMEQQTLADMDHPNIARIIDAGVTASGLHYIAMEYVKGEQLLDYCRKYYPTLRVKINLMLQCCRAIQHAHQKGIIHRDLKPGNVMVTSIDGEPVIKVIDFGIAKALSLDVERTHSGESSIPHKIINGTTEFGTLTGTPLFMSPEQYSSRNQKVDTRSDIYALGALFYTLLTGKPPYDSELAKGKSIDEIRDMVLGNPPPLPSERDPQNAHYLRGDLDAIILKAMNHNPEARYQTVAQLYQDLQYYLSDYPISAIRASTWTKIKKFSRRNKKLIAAATLSIAGLLTGLVMAVVKERRAVESEKLAHHQSLASDLLLSSMAISQNNYSMARSILERNADAVDSHWNAPMARLDWRLLTAKLPVPPVTLASFPTRIYFGLVLSERNEIACGCKDSHLRVICGNTGKLRLDIDTRQKEINGLALSPDQQLIASGGDDGTVKLWSTKTGELAGSFQASTKSVFQLGWSADGKFLVTAGIEPDAIIWSVPEFQAVGRLDSARESLECLDVSRQGDIVYGSSKGIVRIGSLNQVQSAEIQDISLSTSRVFAVNRCSTVVASPSGRLLAAGLDNGYFILLQKINNQYHAVERIRFKSTVTAIAFARDENRVALGEDSGLVHILNLLGHWPAQSKLSFTKYFTDNNTGTLRDSIPQSDDLWDIVTRTEPPEARESLPLDCDRVYLEFAKPLVDPLFVDNYLLEWMDESGQVKPSWAEIPTEVNVKGDGIEIKFENRFGGWQTEKDLHLRGRLQSWTNHAKRVSSLLWSKDETGLFSTSEDGNVNRLDARLIGKNIISRTNIVGLIPCAYDHLVLISNDYSISELHWSRAGSEPSTQVNISEQFAQSAGIVADPSRGLLLCAQGKLGDHEKPWSIYRWDLMTNKEDRLYQFPDNFHPQLILGAVDDDHYILLYRDNSESHTSSIEGFLTGCWNIKLGKLIWSMPATEVPIRFQKLSPRRRYLSLVKEREVILTNPLTGEQKTLRDFPDTPITATRFSTDDRFIAVATSDRRIVCFHTDSGQEAWTITLPGSAACDLFWSKDLETIACVSRDGFLRTFDVDLRQLTSELRLSLSDPVSIQCSPSEDVLYILDLNGSILRLPCNVFPQSP